MVIEIVIKVVIEDIADDAYSVSEMSHLEDERRAKRGKCYVGSVQPE